MFTEGLMYSTLFDICRLVIDDNDDFVCAQYSSVADVTSINSRIVNYPSCEIGTSSRCKTDVYFTVYIDVFDRRDHIEVHLFALLYCFECVCKMVRANEKFDLTFAVFDVKPVI